MKREYCYRLQNYELYEQEAIVRRAGRMAKKGWLLDSMGRWLWRYRRVQPGEYTFAATFFSAASAYDDTTSPSEEEYIALCEAAGWHFVGRMAQLMLFYALPGTAPTPIETDEALRLAAIHGSMKKEYLPGQAVMLFLAALQLFTQGSRLQSDFIENTANLMVPVILLLWGAMGLYFSLRLAGHVLWYRRSRRAVAAGGVCAAQATAADRVMRAVLTGCIAVCLPVFALYGAQESGIGFLLGLLAVLFGFFAVLLAVQRQILRSGNDAFTNKLYVTGAAVLGGVILVAVLIGVASGGGLGGRPEAPESYTTMIHGTEWTFDVWHDETGLPLDALFPDEIANAAAVSTSRTVRQSPLMREESISIDFFYEGQYERSFGLTLARPGLASLYGPALNDMLGWGIYEGSGYCYEQIDAPAWGAQAVWRRVYAGGAAELLPAEQPEGMSDEEYENDYLPQVEMQQQWQDATRLVVCCPGALLYINSDAALTDAQITLLVKALGLAG